MNRKRRAGENHRLVLAACLLAHLVLIGWWAQWRESNPGSDTSLQVVFIETAARAAPSPMPPFPVAPQRARRAESPSHTASRPVPRDSVTPAPSPSAEELLSAPASTARLLEAVSGVARQGLGEISVPERDLMKRQAATLPGRDEPFTPQAIALRRQITPEDVVKGLGAFLFGANYDACLDTRMKIRDLAARNQRIGDDELRVLIDREHRRCR